MTDEKKGGEPSAWAGTDIAVDARLVPAAPSRRLEVGGAPVTEKSHEFVIRKPNPDAPN